MILENANVCLNDIHIEKCGENCGNIHWDLISTLSSESLVVQCLRQNNGIVAYIVPNRKGLEEGEIGDVHKFTLVIGNAVEIYEAIDAEERRAKMDAIKTEMEAKTGSVLASTLSPTLNANPTLALDSTSITPVSTSSLISISRSGGKLMFAYATT